MYLTSLLINFLDTASKLSNSTILLTDTERVLLVYPDTDKVLYLNKKISSDLKNIIRLYSSDICSINYMNTTMDSIIKITEDDSINMYSSQIILPIVHEGLEGLLIFFTNNRKYIPSNLNFAKTTRKFAESFSTKAYL